MENIKINCHSSICIDDAYYFDPFHIKEKKQNAKIVFLTHPHFDHLDPSSIKNVINSETIIVCPKSCLEGLKQFANKIIVVSPDEKRTVDNVEFKTFPSYNLGKYHPIENGFVGYTLSLNGTSYTICGDTDDTPKLRKQRPDILFVPIGGTYTMDAVQGANLANKVMPKIVIPVHYAKIEGTAGKEAEKTFLENLNPNIEYRILIKWT